MQANNAERGRITARITAHAQQLIETAAEMTATTTNQFVAQAALREAERVIDEYRVIRLSEADSQRFLDALDNPQPLSDRLTASLSTILRGKNYEPGSTSRTLEWKPRRK
ncbi:DUF1778 domain-containing protein [Stenotrophomonas sp.]|uniref:type II toxin-antitoxin system TacA family antitoxin n=1 Tax=Stenotrophomonas sp. TaxID=69392 RepID=UPI002FCA8376